MTAEGKCGLCGGEANLRCSGCGLVYYCDKKHQKTHWKQHKLACKPVIEVHDPEAGRYLVANRDFKEGQLIIHEKPLVLGPLANSAAVCLGCHIPITDENAPRCPGCHWPLCSTKCAESPLHKDECVILATDVKKVGPPISLKLTPRYDVILSLRCLLMKSAKPKVWEFLQGLVSHSKARQEDKEVHQMTTVKYLTDVLNAGCDEQTAHHIRGAIVTNSINTYNPKGATLRGLYPSIYLLNHSCKPNVTLRSDANNALYIHTSLPVKQGERLVFSYVPTMDPVWLRQSYLKEIYYFTCRCERCTDPTELGSYFSSPKCSKCSDGLVQPLDGLDSPWKCPKCNHQIEQEEIIQQVDDFTKNLDNRCISGNEVIKLLQEIEKVFHMDHYVWVLAVQGALSAMKNDSHLQTMVLRRDLWRHMLHLLEILEPGNTRRRGISMCEMALAERETAETQFSTGELIPPAYHMALTRPLGLLEKAAEMLRLEPPESTELRWQKIVQKELSDIRMTVNNLEKDYSGL